MKRLIVFILIAILLMIPLTIVSFSHPKVNKIRKGTFYINKYNQQIRRALGVSDSVEIYREIYTDTIIENGETNYVEMESTTVHELSQAEKLRLWNISKRSFIKMKRVIDSMAVIYGIE